MNIIEWMIENKIASHWKQAQNIIVGLKLGELYNEKNYDEIKHRCELYRRWRPKTDKKNQVPTWQAYELAIAGIDPADVEPRQIEMTMIDMQADRMNGERGFSYDRHKQN